jgi:hypothetical protein
MILTTLEEEPHVNFFPWELDVRNAAASMCKAISPRGHLSLVLTDPQWDVYPANQIVNQAGQPDIAPRYVPPVYVEVNDAMTSVQLYVAKSSNDKLMDWVNGEEALKTVIEISLGRVVSQVVRCPTNGFTLMSILDIMAAVRARYGLMQKDTRASLDARMIARLQSTQVFDAHLSNLAQQFVISQIGGFPVNEDEKVRIFRESVFGHPLIAKALEKYDFDFPDSRTQTFQSISAYVLLNLPNLQDASRAAERATANTMTSEVYLTLEAENKKLKSSQAQKKRGGGKGKGKGNKKKKKGRQQGDKIDKTDKSDKPLLYCHAHGAQHTHGSRDCKLMAADTTRFTAAMRNAKDAEHPHGGSTKVLGQEPK